MKIVDVLEKFDDFLERHQLRVLEIAEDEALLVSSFTTLWIFRDPDGIDVSYIGKDDVGNFFNWPLGVFLRIAGPCSVDR